MENNIYKEENKEVDNNYTKKNQNKGKVGYVIIITILVMALIGEAFLIGYKFSNNENNTKSILNNNVEIKKTNSSTVKSDGVYITDVSEVVDNVMPSIVAITSKTIINSGRYGSIFNSGNYTSVGAGSGVIVSQNDNEIFILTNYHVVEDTTELSVNFIDDKSYDATIKGVSEKNDIAIVSVSKKDIESSTLESIKVATLGSSDELKVGNGIIAIGNALGYGQSVTTGVVSALNREIKGDDYAQDMIQIDAAINGGNSGGALLNSKGEVVGINRAKYSSNSLSSSSSIEGMGFAIPISNVTSVIEKLIKGENDNNDSSLTLGIEGYMTNSTYMSGYGLPTGFYVLKIMNGGNAEKSDLEIGNIIVEIDGNKVTSLESIKKVLNKKEKGNTVKLKVKYVSKNEYKEKEIDITLN